MATEQEQLVAGITNHLQKTYGDQSPSAMRKLFDHYDADRNGTISKKELTQLLKDIDIGNTFTRGAWVRGILDKVDSDDDQAISWEEFQHVVGVGVAG